MPRTSPTASRWCFTHNIPDDALDTYELEWENAPGIRYGVYQLERAPTTGQLHAQGYLELDTKRTLSVMVNWLAGAHFEPAKGSGSQNYDYCTKSDSRVAGPFEYGERILSKQGKRSDLVRLRNSIMLGKSDRDLLLDDDLSPVFLRHPNLPTLVRRLLHPPRRLAEPPTVILCIGGPGTGKSHYASERYPDAYWKPADSIWWDDLAQHDVVIFDDFSGHCLPHTSLKRVLDKNPYKAQVKGSYVELQASTFVITTNKLPDHWYSDQVFGSDGRDALWRRITRVLEFRITHGLRQWSEVTNFEEFRSACLINGKYS